MELSYKGLVAGDRVEVTEEHVDPNCDGWRRDMPRNPWNDVSYTEMISYGTVEQRVAEDGSSVELFFVTPLGWYRPISSFKQVRKITEEEWKAGSPRQTGYEKDKDGNRVPCGTAKREYCKRYVN